MPKPVPMTFCNSMLCQPLLSEVLLGLLFSTLKWQKAAIFLRAEPKLLEMESFIQNPKIAIQPSEKHFLLQ